MVDATTSNGDTATDTATAGGGGVGFRAKFFPPPLLSVFGRKSHHHQHPNHGGSKPPRPSATATATTSADPNSAVGGDHSGSGGGGGAVKTSANSNTSNHTTSSNSRTTSLEAMLGLEIGFANLYTLNQKLNSGSFASVWVCTHKITASQFAVKVIDRPKLKPKDDAAVYREVSILKSLSGSYDDGIINLIDFFETPVTFHLILELARGGDVFDRLSKRTVYTEKFARDLARRLLDAVRYIHSYGIVHRDLKPENLLLVDEINDTNIKLGDFGFAKRLADSPGGLRTRCGTPAFVAPEILLGIPYGSAVDMWSCGVILYLLLGGYPPFQAENSKALFRKIRAADYVFHDKYWENVSIEAKQLIASLLQVDPSVRYDASAALRSRWMSIDDEELSDSDLSGSLSQMRKFNARRKLKGAMHAVNWAVHAKFWDEEKISFSTKSTLTGSGGDKSAESAIEGWSKKSKLSGVKVGKTFKDLYVLEDKIRAGSFATIWKARHKESGHVWAVKVVKRKDLKPKDDAQFLQEVAILQSLRHKNIVALNDLFEEKDYFYLVMELLNGGDVFDRIVEKNHYTELDARNLARELLSAVAYMHDRGVAHRDLKPQNLLLVSKDDDADIKVADFGFAKRVHVPNSLMTRCGTPTYVAPEVLKNHPHDMMVDMWSVGIIIYVLLVGYPPFMEENQRQLFRKIRMGEYEFYREDWEDISAPAKDLISKLLVVDPNRRITANAALQHEWICKVDEDDLSARSLSSSLDSLRSSVKSLQTEDGYTAEWLVQGREMIE
mmetsp:Transcript_34634/g.69966  ORF Transcript_34634/g.69966 Transcript_34634/m.69966 type:complete len:781 (-) Transcript_34634:3058-5400(-)